MPLNSEDQDLVDWFSPTEADPDAGEFEDELLTDEQWEEAQRFRTEEGPDPPPSKGLTLSPRLLELRRMGRESRLPRAVWNRLLAAAELDLLRSSEDRLGMEMLYEAMCARAYPFWLDPLPFLNQLLDNLTKFHGDVRVLRSFVHLLIQLARNRISPGDFLRYVLMPRMGSDCDWRAWRERHFWALERITEGLIQLRSKQPFDADRLGSNQAPVDRLINKYVGKPLARFRVSEMEESDYLQRYFEAWSKLKLNNPFFLQFCRANVFPFLYRLSGKVDLVQWVRVMDLLVLLEQAIGRNLKDIDSILANKVLSFRLYKNFEENMMQRQAKGQKPYDMVREIRAFLQSVIALLDKNGGPDLVPWLAERLYRDKDPDLAEAYARLIPQIEDDGGLGGLRHHLVHLGRTLPSQREEFLEQVYAHGGHHPSVNPPSPPSDIEEEGRLGRVEIGKSSSEWIRVVPSRRSLNAEVLIAARSRIRKEVWDVTLEVMRRGPTPPTRLMPQLQQVAQALRGKPAMERVVQIAEYFLRNLPYANSDEVHLACLVAAAALESLEVCRRSLGEIAAGVALLAWEDEAIRRRREFLIEDVPTSRPALQHLRFAIEVFLGLLRRGEKMGWGAFRHVRPTFRAALSRILLGKEVEEGVFFTRLAAGLERAWQVGALALDRFRFWDALSTVQQKTTQRILLQHTLGKEGWARTVACLPDGGVLALARWQEKGSQWSLRLVEVDGSVLFTWGQNDLLRLWAHWRSLWEAWSTKIQAEVRIDANQWTWKHLDEMPQAIRALEERLGILGPRVAPGGAQRLLDALQG